MRCKILCETSRSNEMANGTDHCNKGAYRWKFQGTSNCRTEGNAENCWQNRLLRHFAAIKIAAVLRGYRAIIILHASSTCLLKDRSILWISRSLSPERPLTHCSHDLWMHASAGTPPPSARSQAVEDRDRGGPCGASAQPPSRAPAEKGREPAHLPGQAGR